MRKYTQLGLVIICVLSIGGLLVMERRYSKMKVFLEVADIFQTSESRAKCNQQLEKLRATLEQAYLPETTHAVVGPSWRQIGAPPATTFAYSALYRAAEAKVVVLMVSSVKPESCRLRFRAHGGPSATNENHHEIAATVSVLATLDGLSAMAVNCPMMMTTTTKASTNSSSSANATLSSPVAVDLLGVSLPVSDVTESPSAEGRVAICVRPLDTTVGEVQVAEFVTYYSHIGVADFLVYDESLPGDLKTFVKRTPFIEPTVSAHQVDWNVPTSLNATLTEAVFKADCLLRSGATSRYVAMLSLNEYLVLRREPANVTAFLATVLHNAGEVLAVHERLFCEEFADDVIASALNYPFVTLRKTRFSRNDKQHRLVFAQAGSLAPLAKLLPGGLAPESGRAYVSEGSAHLNVYTSCRRLHFWLRKNNLLQQQQQQNAFQSSVDTYLTKLHELFFSSRLYKHTLHQKSPTYYLIA